ncbi:MAG: FIST N-terminal domain-containing protein [Planctomycetota bacterium]|jgi:hypothetical protein
MRSAETLSRGTLVAAAVSMMLVGCGGAPEIEEPTPPPAAKAKKPVVVGTGYSEEKDALKAGTEAAAKAKAALAGEEAKVVIVFCIAGRDFTPAQVLEGVCTVFDPGLVVGCTAYNAITQEGNNGTAAVLAMGGGINVTTTLGDVEGNDYEGCGRQLGEALKDAAGVEADGKFVALFGDCHVNKNDKVVKGLCSVLGERFPVVGAAAKGDLSFDKGKVVGKKKNVGVLVTGDFDIGCSTLNEGPPDVDPNKLVAAAGQAFKNAVGADLDRTVMVFAFDCGGRRGKMGKDRPRELGVMQAVVGKDMPIFGFYGSGEMGPKMTGDVPRGVGYHISACAIKRK